MLRQGMIFLIVIQNNTDKITNPNHWLFKKHVNIFQVRVLKLISVGIEIIKTR